jgi:hypothetical protein
MTRLPQVAICCIALLAASGCVKYTQPVVDLTPETPEARNFQAVWSAAQETLRDYRFQIQRTDRRAGLIVTEPMVSMYPTEFWRKDIRSSEKLFESSLHRMYRAAVVQIAPGDQPGTYRPRTRVLVGRSERQHAQVTEASQVAQVYAGGGPRIDYGQSRLETSADASLVDDNQPETPEAWIPVSRRGLNMPNVAEVGRDVALEARLDHDIRRRAAKVLSRMAPAEPEQAPQPPGEPGEPEATDQADSQAVQVDDAP